MRRTIGKTRVARPVRRTRRARRTRSIRRVRGGASAGLIEPLRTALADIFAGYSTTIEEIGDKLDVRVQCRDRPNRDLEDTVLMTISPSRMMVDALMKCTDGVLSGSEILRRLIALGRRVGIPTMALYDASTVYFPPESDPNPSCAASLWAIHILTSPDHHSWYNSFGLRSADYDNEVRDNTELATSPAADLVESIARERRRKEMDRARLQHTVARRNGNSTAIRTTSNALQRIQGTHVEEWEDEIHNQFHEVFPSLNLHDPSITIESLVKQMVARVRQAGISCRDPAVQLFRETMNAMEQQIRYQQDLSLVLIPGQAVADAVANADGNGSNGNTSSENGSNSEWNSNVE